MPAYEKKDFLERGRRMVDMRAQMEQVADAVCARGFDNIIMIGAGGTMWMPDTFRYMFLKLTDIPCLAFWTQEIMTADIRQLTDRSLVIAMSTTAREEMTNAVQYCLTRGAQVISLVGVEKSRMGDISTHAVYLAEKTGGLSYIPYYYLAFRIMHNRGFFPDYQRFADQLALLPEGLYQASLDFEPLATKLAETVAEEPFSMWLASGIAFGETCRFSTCTLEEVHRLRTQPVNSSEFFHGPFEVVDEELCAVLVKNEDGNRVLDERTERFLQKYGKKYFVLDPKETALAGISPEFRPYLVSSVIRTVFLGTVMNVVSEHTGRSMKTRRYYDVVEY